MSAEADGGHRGRTVRIPRSFVTQVPGRQERKESLMKRTLFAVAVLTLVVPCLVWGQTSPQKAAPAKSTKVEQELIKLEQDWAKATVARDIQTFARMEADDYFFTDDDGTTWGKAKDLEDVKTGVFVVTSFVSDDIKVSVNGDAAVVTGRTTMKAQYKGKDASGQIRWTDTWIKRGGVWQCVAEQVTRIPPTMADEAAIRQEVLQAAKSMWAAAAKMDPDMMAIFGQDGPDFTFIMPDGKIYTSSAEFNTMWREMAAQFPAQKMTTHVEKVIVLAPDAALYLWQGGDDLIQKDGAVLRSDPYAGTYLCRKVGNEWKFVYGHESGLPLAPVKPVEFAPKK
jgi:ketosteroid isomerase-like protein